MPLLKALIINLDDPVPIPIPVMFNPPDYQLNKSNNFSSVSKPGKNESEQHFISGDMQELSLKLFFDTTDLGVDVRLFTHKIYRLIEIPEGKKEPPKLMFVWGPMLFECRMSSVSQKFEQFDSLGQALRAYMDVTLVGYDRIQDKKGAAKQAADSLVSVVVKAGDSIHSLAASTLGDAKKWRAVAKENNIKNPLQIKPGDILKIPKAF